MKSKFYLFLFCFSVTSSLMAQIPGSYTSMLMETWLNNGWVKQMRYTYTIDKGSVTQAAGDVWTPTNSITGSWDKMTLTAYTYSNSLLSQTYTQMWYTNKWNDSQKTIYTYDGAKNMLTMTSQSYMGAAWMDFAKITNTYNGSNQLTVEVYQTVDYMTFQLKNTSRTTYTYNPDGTEKEEVTQMWNGTSWDDSSRDTYTYDGSKNIATIVSESKSTGSWVNNYKEVYSYNKSLSLQNSTAAASVKEILFQNWDAAGSKWNDISKDIYSYNSGGALTEILTQDWKTSAWVNADKMTFTPTSGPSSVQSRLTADYISIYPNPCSNNITIENPGLGASDVYFYNTAGQMVKSFNKQQAVSRINLSDLSRGTYMVKVVTPGSEQVIKLLKVE